MLWPMVLALLGIRRGSRVALATILLSPFARVASWYALPMMRERIGEMFFTVADPIAFGCLLALQRRWLWQQRWYVAIMNSRWFFVVPIAALALRFTNQHPMTNFVIAQPLMNLGIMLTLDWCMNHASSPVGRFLDWKPLAFLGTLSYSLYLWQMPFLNHFSRAPWTVFPINLALSVMMALASYKLVEQPFLKLKDALHEKREQIVRSPA
jgi:peptidoglycan/LPS O-acetylase OafA/YrhL